MAAFKCLRYSAAFVTVLSTVACWLSADVPYPKCSQCPDPNNYSSYLFLPAGILPNDYDPKSDQVWKFEPGTGMNIRGAWQVTTGRPDVVVADLDSGIFWDHRETANKVALNIGELPLPPGCTSYDCNHDGVVNVQDYASVADKNGNGFTDAQDLIRTYSNGVDNDGNGYVDDIAGWDFFENDNDPEDDVRFGHGTGQASDAAAEANNGSGFPGVAPNLMFIPLRVGDSFIAIDTDFAQAVVYAVDCKVSLISEALGTLTATQTSQEAINYAYRNGIPLVASAADEESFHHNFPAAYEHSIWVNSIRNGDGNFVTAQSDYTILNGCTNYGGNAWVTISSISCSSEATGRAAGLVGLLVAHGKNLIDKGKLTPYPGLQTPFSAEEVRQILRWSAQDINQSADLSLSMSFALRLLLGSLFPSTPAFQSSQFPTQAGWDQYTGYGRPDAAKLVSVTAETIPPEADLSGGLKWFATVDPGKTGSVPVIGSAAAVRAPGSFDYTVEVGCGVQPASFTAIGSGSSSQPLQAAVLAQWDLAKTVSACSLRPADVVRSPDADTVTLRLRVTDSRGNVGEDRRTIALHSDGSLKFGPVSLQSSAESSPVLADINRDGVLDIVYATTDGAIHALSGSAGRELLGFPAWTDLLPVHASPAYSARMVSVPREPVLAPLAADDLDGDGTVEIVAASTEGKVYVFDDHARIRPGFPVSTDPAFSLETNRDSYNDLDPGITGAPTLADLDGGGSNPDLEIIVGALDRHIYAWRANGDPVPGFPVLLADPTKVTVGAGDRVSPKDPTKALEMPAKIVGSPAVGDLDGDGYNEIVAATNEQYSGETTRFALDSRVAQIVSLVPVVSVDVMGRVYAIQHDGTRHAGGPFRPGWPAPVPVLVPGFLPTVGTGTPGSPALADLDGSGKLTVAIFSAAGPVALWDADAKPVLGTQQSGAIQALAMDFPGATLPDTAGSADAPFIPLVGSGAFGDITGDNLPEYVAPTAGIRAVFDMLAPGQQEFSDHQVTAWDPKTGQVLPAFPRIMDDLMFLTSPALADIDGDGKADILQGSGGYLLRAFRSDGKEPDGWPKFTHGWILATPVVGDVDGDGLLEVVATTREGTLYVWDTPAAASASAVPWQGYGRDRRRSQNLNSGVSPLSPQRSAGDHWVWLREAAGRSRVPLKPRKGEGWRVASGKWQVASGKWQVASGKWQVASGSGKWRVASGEWQQVTKGVVTR